MPMITKQELENDEIEAINKYQAFLDQGVSNIKLISIIKRIKEQEQHHLRLLRKVKSRY